MQTNTTNKTTIFFLVGLMGSGKTHWGKLLSEKNNFNFVDLDAAIESSAELSIAQIFAEKGAVFFRNLEAEILTQTNYSSFTIVATGGGTPCYHNNMQWMNENGVTLWLNQSIEKIVEQIISEKKHRPLIADVSNQHLSAFFADLLQERKFYYQQSKHCLSANEINETNFQKIIDFYV